MPNNTSSRLLYGCMSLGGEGNKEQPTATDYQQANAVVDAALEAGIIRFDHADIYARGKAEMVFGRLLKERPEIRRSISIQSKCGIRFRDDQGPNRYDFSAQWIESSVDGILARLRTERLDTLLLHRPDPLMEIDEVAHSFERLIQAGKVEKFGVSNMHGYQIDLLQSALQKPLVANQLELSLEKHQWIDEGINIGHENAPNSVYSGGTLEYCRRHNIEIQAWSPLCRGIYCGAPTNNDNDSVRQTSNLVSDLANKYGVARESIVLAWLLRHPYNINAVIGTTNKERIKACAQAEGVDLSRGDWYSLYVSARGENVP